MSEHALVSKLMDTSLAIVLASTILVLYYIFVCWKQERVSGVPHVPSQCPYLGYNVTYFASACLSSVQLRKRLGDVYTMVLFGRL